jgi:cyanophycinase
LPSEGSYNRAGVSPVAISVAYSRAVRNRLAFLLVCSMLAALSDFAGCRDATRAAAQVHPGLKIFSLPAAEPKPAGRPTFAAALVGGAGDVDAATHFLCDHSGGGEIVVLRASGTDAYNPYFHQLCPNNSVTTLLITSAGGAREAQAMRHLERAHAIFIAGGDQSNYVRFWAGPLERAINADIERGVPIGGISAGLAVLGQFVFSARRDTISSAEALANPFDPKLTLDRDFLSLPILRGIITDSHFSERQRLGRTVAFLARIRHDGWANPARAIGVDQETAVLVRANGQAEVVGKGSAFFLELTQAPERCAPNQPLSVEGVRGYEIRGESPAGAPAHFDLKSWSGTGGESFIVGVANGAMTGTGGHAPQFR